ncbi:MAG: hypothetical protein GF334_09985 [Candidatus Altiarchaeales archaeon]|nr:hypothetical protein [Candidatus Altiarchaeales archaeon]
MRHYLILLTLLALGCLQNQVDTPSQDNLALKGDWMRLAQTTALNSDVSKCALMRRARQYSQIDEQRRCAVKLSGNLTICSNAPPHNPAKGARFDGLECLITAAQALNNTQVCMGLTWNPAYMNTCQALVSMDPGYCDKIGDYLLRKKCFQKLIEKQEKTNPFPPSLLVEKNRKPTYIDLADANATLCSLLKTDDYAMCLAKIARNTGEFRVCETPKNRLLTKKCLTYLTPHMTSWGVCQAILEVNHSYANKTDFLCLLEYAHKHRDQDACLYIDKLPYSHNDFKASSGFCKALIQNNIAYCFGLNKSRGECINYVVAENGKTEYCGNLAPAFQDKCVFRGASKPADCDILSKSPYFFPCLAKFIEENPTQEFCLRFPDPHIRNKCLNHMLGLGDTYEYRQNT